MERILLAVDGSKSSQKAAEKTTELAEPLKTEVAIITVLEELPHEVYEVQSLTMPEELSFPSQPEEIISGEEEKFEERGKSILNKAAAAFENTGVEVRRLISYGDPADIICDYADAENFDLIVLADKGKGGVKRFLLGSISDKVVRHANVSVLIVK